MKCFHLVFFLLLTSFSSNSNELDLNIKMVKDLFTELSDSSFQKSCHSEHSNVLYFSKKMGGGSLNLFTVNCGEPILSTGNCSINSESSVLTDEQNNLIRVSTSYGAVNIEDEDDYHNANSFLSIKKMRENTNVQLAEFDNGPMKKALRNIILSKNSISAIIVRPESIMFHYMDCGCTGIETVYHDGNLHNVSSFKDSVAYFEWRGCDKELTQYFANKAGEKTS